jgi:peroxiredoxin
MSKNLQPGMTLPDFELPDEDGVMHRLSDLQGDDFMVLMLGRGEHCPRERQQQKEMLKFHEWSDIAFTRVVTVLPNDLHDVYKLRISTGAHWPFLGDPDLVVRSTLEIDEYTDPHHDNAMVPHTLILSPGLKIERVYVGYWFWGRPSIHRLWDDLREVFRELKADFDPTTPEARADWEAAQLRPAGARRGAGTQVRLALRTAP